MVSGVRLKISIITFKVYDVGHWICGASLRVRHTML
jgi:hypothetical protein